MTTKAAMQSANRTAFRPSPDRAFATHHAAVALDQGDADEEKLRRSAVKDGVVLGQSLHAYVSETADRRLR